MVVGVILLLMGVVFSLQGMDVITGSSVMSGVSAYIYIGAVVAIAGLLLIVLGLRSGGAPSKAPLGTPSPPTQ
jgi:Mg2+ and Co2+ transporter CorA